VERGDVIVGFAGETVAGFDDLHRVLTEERVGNAAELIVLSRARKLTLNITPREQAAAPCSPGGVPLPVISFFLASINLVLAEILTP